MISTTHITCVNQLFSNSSDDKSSPEFIENPEKTTSLVNSLCQELVVDFKHFESYFGFKKWLSVIPDNLLTQLVDRLIETSHILPHHKYRGEAESIQKSMEIPKESKEFVVLLNRSELENILLIKLMRTINDHIRSETENMAIIQNKIMRIQAIFKIYSMYIPFLDLYRACYGNSTDLIFYKSLKNQLEVCNRLKREMTELTAPNHVKSSGSYRGLLSCFNEIKEYVDNYDKEVAEYNREVKYLLLMRLKLNRDLFLYIIGTIGSTMTPPFT